MRLSQIAECRDELEARVLATGYETTERDLAQAQELVSQYIDELERLENSVTVEAGTNVDRVADRIISGWYPNG